MLNCIVQDFPFNNLQSVSWLTRYYEVADVFCASVNHTLEDLFGSREAKAARKLIAAARSDGLKNVKANIEKHRLQFNKIPEQRRSALQVASIVAKKSQWGITATCPACGSEGILEGTRLREGKPEYNGVEIVIDTTYLSDIFICPVCSLALTGEQEIFFAGMQPTFTMKTTTNLHDIFDADFEDEYMNM